MRQMSLAFRIARIEREISRLQGEDMDGPVAAGELSVEEKLERLYDELADLEDNGEDD